MKEGENQEKDKRGDGKIFFWRTVLCASIRDRFKYTMSASLLAMSRGRSILSEMATNERWL